MRDTLTPLGTDKTLQVSITPYNQKIESLVYEIRTSDGSKVIENNKINHFEEEEDGTLSCCVYFAEIHIDGSGVCAEFYLKNRAWQLELLYKTDTKSRT